MLIHRRIKSYFVTENLKAKSTRGYSRINIFICDKGFVNVYPMTSTSKFLAVLQNFAKEVGTSEVLVADPHQ